MTILRLTAAALAAALAAGPALADDHTRKTVRDKETCAQAVADATQAVEDGSVGDAARQSATDLVTIADHLCGEANFVYAEKALSIARGMVAEE